MRNAALKDPFYEINWINGSAIEVFYTDDGLAARVRRLGRLVLVARLPRMLAGE
jgi:hypothetical protein